MTNLFSDYNIIDLTLPLSRDTVIYPGEEPVRIEQVYNFKTSGFNVHKIAISTHHGTHIDVPYHYSDDGRTLDQFSVKDLFFQAFKIDLYKSSKNNKYCEVITKDLISPYEEYLKTCQAVLFSTGYEKYLKTGDNSLPFPCLTEDCAEYLAGFSNLKLIGIDSLSVDPEERQPAHKILLKNEILILENAVNLTELPAQFFLAVIPLPFKGVDGSPCRALAFVRNEI